MAAPGECISCTNKTDRRISCEVQHADERLCGPCQRKCDAAYGRCIICQRPRPPPAQGIRMECNCCNCQCCGIVSFVIFAGCCFALAFGSLGTTMARGPVHSNDTQATARATAQAATRNATSVLVSFLYGLCVVAGIVVVVIVCTSLDLWCRSMRERRVRPLPT